MGYCRFQNTKSDLSDCLDHMSDMDLSEEENKARLRLIEICQNIVEEAKDNNLIEDDRDDD